MRQDGIFCAKRDNWARLLKALVRDGYRCVLTGVYDYDSGVVHPELVDRAVASGLGLTTVDCTHIFPESVQIGEREAILEMFGLSDEAESLRNPNRLSNVISMHEPLLRRFDLLDFWFEEVIGEPDTYNIQGVWLVWTMRPPLPKRVRFAVDPEFAAACRTNGRPVPALPSPSLLAVRAVCLRVAHISGAIAQANQICRDVETSSGMAKDGSMAYLLTSCPLHSVNWERT
ncbi:hypothetical protein DFH06DRAFT_1131465 [Mycena polygramma]|nr:hypothetical protein DFH06DRAFT_1131465 [Mycena polygramma]